MARSKLMRTITSIALISLSAALLSAAGPGKIQAEAFSNMLGVATEACSDSGGGLDVGWIDKGDWMVYPITISTSGAYTISYRVATPNSGMSLSVDLNAGSTQLGSVNIPNTGGWQTWTTVTQTVNLTAGSYNFGINAGTGGFNLNWFSIDSSIALGGGDSTPYFMIVNKYSGKALDLIGGDTSNGARINQWTFDSNGPNQRWAVLPTENQDHFKLISWVSGKCACIDADSTANSAQLHDWDYVGGNPSQQWDLIDTGNGWFKIRNVRSGKVLDDSGWGTGNDNPIIQWDDAGGDNQLWRLQPWCDYYIKAASDRYICVANMGNTDGARIIQYDQQNNPWFKWRFVSEGDGWYGCFSLNAPSKVLCVDGPSTTPGHFCHLWEYNTGNIGDQKIRVMPQLDGTFKFYFAFDGQTWDIPGGQTGNNVELDQYTDNGNAWQRFKLERVLTQSTPTKSAKRGIAYDLQTSADLSALKSGVSWWYNWGVGTNAPASYSSTYGIDYIPMSWNGNNIATGGTVDSYLSAHPECKYLLVMNEPNFLDQADLSIAQVVALWPQFEAMAQKHGVKLVGPAMNWGTVNTSANPADPIAWLDGFFSLFQSTYGHQPQVDAIAFHWYDYGLVGGGTGFLDDPTKLPKYGKKIWVTEFANWHSQTDGAQIDTVAKQKAQMQQWVSWMETHDIVERYAWFTGRQPGNPFFTSLFQNFGLSAAQGDGVLSELGQYYISLPVGQ